MDGIHVIEIEEMNLRGSYVIDGFPSIGLVGSIVANYLVSSLKLRQVGVIDSTHFPTVSTIKNGLPYSPVRIHAGEINEGADRMVVFLSDFQPPPHIVKELGATMMNWVEEHHCRLLITPEGISTKQTGKERESGIELMGVGSTPEAREMLKAHDIPVFENGVLIGLSGILLNEGVNRTFDVITLLSEASADFPDARAAAAVTRGINQLILNNTLDIKPLLQEAEVIEKSLKDMYDKAGKEDELRKVAIPGMYG
jgi:uncharacterized protein